MKACLSRSLYCNYDTGKYHSFTIFLTSRKYDSAFQDLIIDESIDQEFIGRLIGYVSLNLVFVFHCVLHYCNKKLLHTSVTNKCFLL